MAIAEYITLASNDAGNDLALSGIVANQIESSSLTLAINSEGIAQKLKQALRLQQGSCLYDLDAGFSWFELFGTVNITTYKSRLRSFLLGQPYITSVDTLDVELNENTRTLAIDFRVTTTLGLSVPVTFNTVI